MKISSPFVRVLAVGVLALSSIATVPVAFAASPTIDATATAIAGPVFPLLETSATAIPIDGSTQMPNINRGVSGTVESGPFCPPVLSTSTKPAHCSWLIRLISAPVFAYNMAGKMVASTMSNYGGYFQMPLKPGMYKIQATMPDPTCAAPCKGIYSNSVWVQVTAHHVSSVTLNMPPVWAY